jgi:hypothetical protein
MLTLDCCYYYTTVAAAIRPSWKIELGQSHCENRMVSFIFLQVGRGQRSGMDMYTQQ